MLAIPLPFIVSLLLVITATFLRIKHPIEGKAPSLFVILCAVSTSFVGLRWTFDVAIFQHLQPILASFLPIAAWYCFAKAHRSDRLSWFHCSGPTAITVCAIGSPLWREGIDIILTILYVGYGALLIRSSFVIPEQVRFANIERVRVAERIAGAMLLVSASIDAVLSFDFMVYGGEHTPYIISLSYLILIPIMVVAVIHVGFSICQTDPIISPDTQTQIPTQNRSDSSPRKTQLSEQDAKEIVNKLDALMKDKKAFQDPDLTLSRLSRKIGIPARQISMAVNQACGQNISKMLNEYRIEHAKSLLVNSEDSITDIYLRSGFQTKSNFNREFARITGDTPSGYRRIHAE